MRADRPVSTRRRLWIAENQQNATRFRSDFPVFFTGYREYMATLDRLESLRPEILGLGHHWFTRTEGAAEAFVLARRSAAGLRERERLRDDSRDGETVVAKILNEFYRNELTLYSRENIINCCRLLLRRSLEEEKGC